jgi:hypothetical protein
LGQIEWVLEALSAIGIPQSQNRETSRTFQ